MTRNATVSVVAVCLLLTSCDRAASQDVRESVLAGSWYPGTKEPLRAEVDAFLQAADVKAPPGRLVALISPHAGYRYSGQTAAYGYKLLEGKAFETVVVLAPSHYSRFHGASIADVNAYRTPLGDVPLARKACDALLKEPLFDSRLSAHANEHSLEIQLPFLQRTLKSFQLVPIVMGDVYGDDFANVAEALRKHVPAGALYVVSSDFTHYGRRFGYMPFTDDIEANLRKLDMGAVEKILPLDFDGFLQYRAKTQITVCGRHPIATLLKYLAPAKAKGHLLRYDTSGALTSDWKNSVSYVSIAFTTSDKNEPGGPLTPAEQKTLLRLARDTLDAYVRSGPKLKLDSYDLTPRHREQRGAFVTLHRKGRLRGCTGYIVARTPLYRTVIDNAISAALRDHRFRPVESRELRDIEIEISVLSPVRDIGGPEEFALGKHGIWMHKGSRSAVFLPQVAPEQGWDRETTLRHLSTKAGLPPDGWKKGAKFQVFTAQVFHERKP